MLVEYLYDGCGNLKSVKYWQISPKQFPSKHKASSTLPWGQGMMWLLRVYSQISLLHMSLSYIMRYPNDISLCDQTITNWDGINILSHYNVHALELKTNHASLYLHDINCIINIVTSIYGVILLLGAYTHTYQYTYPDMFLSHYCLLR